MNLQKLNITQIIPYLFYLFIIVYIIQFRYKLDVSGLYVTSDGAIKLYQTVQYKENGFLSLECPYPGKELDSDFKYFPISYPWAIFQAKDPKCVLEYPPFFYWIGSVLLYVFPVKAILYLPLIFYSINILLFNFILKRIGLNPTFRILLTILGFLSFPLLTALDYTENPAFQTFYLLGFYFFWRLSEHKNLKFKHLIITGIIFGIAFIFRLEILMTFSFLCLMYFLFTRDLKNPFFIYTSFIIIATLFAAYNLQTSGHPLGFRYVSSIDFNDNAKADILKRLSLLKAYIWGDEIIVGIFQFQPLCWIMLFLPIFAWIRKIRLRVGNIFLAAGWISFLSIPFYVTVYGGVGYFGLRYLEAPYFLILIGFAVYLSQDYFSKSTLNKWILIIMMIIVGYSNWLATREGLKILRVSSHANSVFQSFLSKSDKFIIHSSLYTSIWMGRSFFEKTHINITGNEAAKDYLKNISANENFVLLLSPEDIYISSDIPKKLYYRYKTQLNLDSLPIQIIEEINVNGVRLVLARKK